MELGKKIQQLRKLSGMTQEQLAEKCNVSRQTISKWEAESSVPDLESVVVISKLFQVSLDDLLIKEDNVEKTNRNEQITLEDLVKINLYNRKMMMLLFGGLILVMIAILNFVYVTALRSTTLSTQYMLYRYIVTGQYDNAPINFVSLLMPSIIAGVVGLMICGYYLIKSRKKK